ncbi:MAG TPA: adenylate/guanylate cyclase domain-containing protein [Chloroflexota bacterium]|nr:adenylate/guanylate cyclase domain-containing protein [Chloroflexota bacterium]
MRCEACHSENPETAKFCHECGGRLPRLCQSCHAPNPATAKFCGECGAQLGDTANPPPPTPAPAPTAAITEVPLVPPIEGERRTVTVLFADMAGFTAMSERLDPEIVTEIINDCLGRAVAAVDRCGGSVNKLTGDGLLALFGAPVAHEDDPARALRASLAVQRELDQLGDELEQRRGVRPRLRIGINTGLVVAGVVGGLERSEYTVMGDAVNVAARLMAAAVPGGVLVGESTQRLTQAMFEFRALQTLEVKGKSEPLVVFELVAEIDRPTTVTASDHAPIIGRDDELDQLQACLRRSLRGRSEMVTIVGEAGMGKTRLVSELLNRVRTQDIPAAGETSAATIWHLACRQDHRQSNDLICQLVREALGLEHDESPELVQTLMESLAADLGMDLERLEPLAQLTHANRGGQIQWDRLYVDPEQARRQLFLLAQQLVSHEAKKHPLILAIDDVNWIDGESLQMLRFLIEHVEALPLLLILVQRPGFESISTSRGRISTSSLLLLPLSDTESEELLRAFFGQSYDVFPDELRQRILSRAGGNPLYLEALARTLMETDALRQEGEFWRLAHQAAEIRVPETIEGVIRARIDELAPGEKRLLQEAAVLGQTFERALLTRYTSSGPLDELLDRLATADLLIEDAGTIRFRHNLVRDVAYESLLMRSREELHRLAAEAIQRLYPDRVAEFAAALAEHYDRAGDSVRALPFLRQSADRATAMYAHTEAARLHTKILDLLKQRDADDLEQAAVCEQLAPAEAAHGNFDAALEHWGWAAEVYEREGQKRNLADVRRAMGVALLARGDLSGARHCFEIALAALEYLPDGPQHAELYQELARLTFHLGDASGAADWARRALDISEGVGAMRAACEAECTLGLALARQGDLEAAIVAVEEALQKAIAHDLPAASGRAYINLAVLYSATDPARASEIGGRGLEMARRVGDAVCSSWLHATLASSYHACAGDYQGAVEHAHRSITLDRQYGLRSHLPVPLIVLAQVMQCHGEMDGAERNYLEALELGNELNDPQILFPCYDGLATLYLELGDDERARDYMARGQDVCSRSGISPDEMFVTPFLY